MNQLRIIAGIYGGRLIKTPKTNITHPMGDRERGAIFNALQHDINDTTTVLDAFAGSGAIGLEALSRGAKHITFLENHPKATRIITENVLKLKVTDHVKIIKTIAGLTDKFDLIIADPPYDHPQYDIITRILKKLNPGGTFVLSHDKNVQPPQFKNLMLISDKTYAAANIKIYKHY